jgi:hypothetical protein
MGHGKVGEGNTVAQEGRYGHQEPHPG